MANTQCFVAFELWLGLSFPLFYLLGFLPLHIMRCTSAYTRYRVSSKMIVRCELIYPFVSIENNLQTSSLSHLIAL